ncbi:nitroreductase family protein [Labrys wisconsinensis]|uniref:Putative NAD(P)H nitroreductase n=1 Tax=Labrys wisconsinensis TaxID=425677 RepID=A0ABU0J446_9HYPH|nr:nitroreductase [Labrys wisconsinensis]MDQ0469044.1 nitroreductase [Labrys wisconsinensis]
MPDAIDLLKIRRSVPPAFLAEPGPDAAQLETLLTIAARVPDHGKLHPWRFIVYAGEAKAKAGRIIEEAFHAGNPDADTAALKKEATRFAAPLIIGVVSTAAPHVKIPVWEQELSAGAVCANLVVAATALGFGASWLTGWFAYDAEVLARLGIEPHERVAGFVHVGTPTEVVPDRPRPALGEIVSHFS